jgi:hypothetical protein
MKNKRLPRTYIQNVRKRSVYSRAETVVKSFCIDLTLNVGSEQKRITLSNKDNYFNTIHTQTQANRLGLVVTVHGDLFLHGNNYTYVIKLLINNPKIFKNPGKRNLFDQNTFAAIRTKPISKVYIDRIEKDVFADQLYVVDGVSDLVLSDVRGYNTMPTQKQTKAMDELLSTIF